MFSRWGIRAGIATAAALLLLSGASHADATGGGDGGDLAIIRLPSTRAAGNCPSDYVCVYRDTEFRGGGYGIRHNFDLNDFRGIEFNDEMSSWINSTAVRYCWHPDINFSGGSRVMGGNTAMAVVTPIENDAASALSDC